MPNRWIDSVDCLTNLYAKYPPYDDLSFSPSTTKSITITSDGDIKTTRNQQWRITWDTKRSLDIEKVVFNDPATIIIWGDGTKTVVKAQNEPYDKEKGFVMACLKRFLGNDNTFNKEIKKWVK